MINKIVFIFMLINLVLNIYGNNWGLPSRWSSDEIVADVLHMADEKTLIDPIGEFIRPTGYHIFLLIFFVPVYLFLKIINYPLTSLKEAAQVSWIHMATQFPDFATGIYIYARTISAILGALTVYLIYFVGKEAYDRKASVFSAISLSVCMGFVAVNHFAQYISLVNLLIVLTILFCVKALKVAGSKDAQRFIYFGFLTAGLGTSVHWNAGVLLSPLLLTFIFSYTNISNKTGEIILLSLICMSCYIIGIIIGIPSLITNFIDYLSVFRLSYATHLIDKPVIAATSMLIGPINYIVELMSIFGIPLFILVLVGIISAIFSWGRTWKSGTIMFSFILTYFFVMTVLNEDKYPQTKYIIAIVPLLAVFAGRAMDMLNRNKIIPRFAKLLVFSLVLLYSFAYSYKGDLHFKSGDTRYASTKWVYENIPLNSKIEVFDQLSYVLSTKVMNDYEIIYLGRSSKEFTSKHFFKWNKVESREEYLKHINKYDSSSDYIIIDLNDLESLKSAGESHILGLNKYLRGLFANRKNYKLVKIVEPINKKIKHKNGFVHFTNLWWDPIPVYRATANTIYIFQRID